MEIFISYCTDDECCGLYHEITCGDRYDIKHCYSYETYNYDDLKDQFKKLGGTSEEWKKHDSR